MVVGVRPAPLPLPAAPPLPLLRGPGGLPAAPQRCPCCPTPAPAAWPWRPACCPNPLPLLAHPYPCRPSRLRPPSPPTCCPTPAPLPRPALPPRGRSWCPTTDLLPHPCPLHLCHAPGCVRRCLPLVLPHPCPALLLLPHPFPAAHQVASVVASRPRVGPVEVAHDANVVEDAPSAAHG